jgi:hypothetical protein
VTVEDFMVIVIVALLAGLVYVTIVGAILSRKFR